MFRIIILITIFLFSFKTANAADLASEFLHNNEKLLPKSTIKILDKVIEDNIKYNKKPKEKSDLDIDLSHGYIDSKSLTENNHYKEDNLEITISDFKKLPDEDKDLSEALAAYEIGQIEIAIYLYKKVLSKSPNNYNALFAIASIYQSNMQIEEARAIYTKILNLYPNDEAALNNFIKLSGDQAPEETISELEKLEALRPDIGLIPAQIAVIYSMMKNYQQAIKYFHRAIILSPSNIDYRYNLAIIYDQIGLDKEAIYLYNQVLKENFTNNDYSYNYQQIAKRINYLSDK